MKTINEIIAALEARKDRSAWGKGVTGYALEIMETVKARAAYEEREPETIAALDDYMLNGAPDWSAASWGGSYEIYDGDIAARLCTPSELKKTRNGERRPNSWEEWIDVQARALSQAAARIRTIAR